MPVKSSHWQRKDRHVGAYPPSIEDKSNHEAVERWRITRVKKGNIRLKGFATESETHKSKAAKRGSGMWLCLQRKEGWNWKEIAELLWS